MGCFWSSEDRDRCIYCNRRAVNNLVFIDSVCEICFSRTSRAPVSLRPSKAQFGEYRCTCGRFWTSRLSRAQTYQICISCKKHVFPHSLRDLRPGDHTQDKDGVQEHRSEYCQMCLQLGYYCGNYGKNVGGRYNKRSRSVDNNIGWRVNNYRSKSIDKFY